MQESYGRYLNSNDYVHLGKVGYRFLANIIKDCVTNNKVDGRGYSDVTSLHRYSVNSGMRTGKRRVESEKNGTVRSERSRENGMNMMRAPTSTSNEFPALSQPSES